MLYWTKRASAVQFWKRTHHSHSTHMLHNACHCFLYHFFFFLLCHDMSLQPLSLSNLVTAILTFYLIIQIHHILGHTSFSSEDGFKKHCSAAVSKKERICPETTHILNTDDHRVTLRWHTLQTNMNTQTLWTHVPKVKRHRQTHIHTQRHTA